MPSFSTVKLYFHTLFFASESLSPANPGWWGMRGDSIYIYYLGRFVSFSPLIYEIRIFKISQYMSWKFNAPGLKQSQVFSGKNTKKKKKNQKIEGLDRSLYIVYLLILCLLYIYGTNTFSKSITWFLILLMMLFSHTEVLNFYLIKSLSVISLMVSEYCILRRKASSPFEKQQGFSKNFFLQILFINFFSIWILCILRIDHLWTM